MTGQHEPLWKPKVKLSVDPSPFSMKPRPRSF